MPCLHLAHSFRSLRVWLFSWNSHYHPIKLLCNDAAVNRMMSPNLSGKMSLTETIFGTGEIPDLRCSHEGGDSDVLSSLLGSIHLHIHGQLAALRSYYSYSRLDEMSDDHPKQFHPLSAHQYRCKCHSDQSDGCRDISVSTNGLSDRATDETQMYSLMMVVKMVVCVWSVWTVWATLRDPKDYFRSDRFLTVRAWNETEYYRMRCTARRLSRTRRPA